MDYEIILTLHIISVFWNIGWVVVADTCGALWVLRGVRLPPRLIHFTHRAVSVGFMVSILTGAYMFRELSDYLLATPAFYTKMLFVLALVVNSFFISKHLRAALKAESFNLLDKGEKRNFFISGAVSTFSWIGVVVSALFLGL